MKSYKVGALISLSVKSFESFEIFISLSNNFLFVVNGIYFVY